MSDRGHWLFDAGSPGGVASVDGLILVKGFRKLTPPLPPEQYVVMERAEHYGAHGAFFEEGRNGGPPVAQAFIYVSAGAATDPLFAGIYRQLWSWGGVPLVYRKAAGVVQLFRCAHRPDFEVQNGELVCRPFKILKLASDIDAALKKDAWWDTSRLRNGTLWDDPAVCKALLSADLSAQKALIKEIKALNEDLTSEGVLPKHLRRKLLILSLLIAYLEAREVFESGFFSRYVPDAVRFFQVLQNGPALVALLADLEERFNGHVFVLEDADRAYLKGSNGQLTRFARLVEARQERSGQLTLWERYSFKDLPVELISHIYQLFVKDADSSVYTPPFLVRLMLEEAMSWERLDWLHAQNAVILDPSCGSGVFLVEAYKRLVIHWRMRNGWRKPGKKVLKDLLQKVCGIDLEKGAVELAAFSLCLALCDALEPEEIRQSIKLFPVLDTETLHHSCFFEAREKGLVEESVGILVGNPPFVSKLTTAGEKRSADRYESSYGTLPDKQLAYLFLHEAMQMVTKGGVLSLLQQYNFLYNQQSLGFRQAFFRQWDVREILDFISVRGLFQKGGADTKIVVVVAEANPPSTGRKILHATFRRSGRADKEQGFDIDYYDMHWLPVELINSNDGVWRSNLFGGGRVLGFVDRLKRFRTMEIYAEQLGWDHGEGYNVAHSGRRTPAPHITGQPSMPSGALTLDGVDESQIEIETADIFRSAYTSKRFTPPMLLIREHMDLPHILWQKSYLTYGQQIVGFCAPRKDESLLAGLATWLDSQSKPLRAYVAASSPRLFCQKSTAISLLEISALPYPENQNLDLSSSEQILVDDVVDYYRDLIRLGDDSEAMKQPGLGALPDFNNVFTTEINAIYKKKPLQALTAHYWPGVVCQPYLFGKGRVDWEGTNELKEKLDGLLHEQKGSSLHVTRIARIYDGSAIYLLKPDRLRYWLRSIALRDSDETLADLVDQGF